MRTRTRNAPAFLDETRDPDSLTVDLVGLRRFDRPVLLSQGGTSAPFFPRVMAQLAGALPHARRHTFAGAGHLPYRTHPDDYVRVLTEFLSQPAPG